MSVWAGREQRNLKFGRMVFLVTSSHSTGVIQLLPFLFETSDWLGWIRADFQSGATGSLLKVAVLVCGSVL